MSSTNITISTEEAIDFRKKMLNWYDKHQRTLPWRALADEVPDPYRVWLSEIMLQQTTVQAVIKYFLKFTDKWPDIHALASAKNEDIMSNWAGLGYYARARNLHKCAKIISQDYNGTFPSDQKELKTLPGIGDYTSAAIRSIAFNKPAVVVDGNVERVMARYHACKVANPKGKANLKDYARLYSEEFADRPSDYAQSLMDLGATICTPKSPACSSCPINERCKARIEGQQIKYPIKGKKKTRPTKHGIAYFVTNQSNEILLQKRAEKGLLGGMYGLPTSDWVDTKSSIKNLELPHFKKAHCANTHIEHVFTHFSLKLHIYTLRTQNIGIDEDYIWVKRQKLNGIGLPTLFKKVINIME